jgi:phage antirepressor YoqD-like protein
MTNNDNNSLFNLDENNNIEGLIQYKEYNNIPVITFEDIAKVHNISIKTVQSAFNRVSDKIVNTIDTFILKGNELKYFIEQLPLKQRYPLNTTMLRVFTESGYLNIVKVMNDEISWSIFQKLKNCYFNIKEKANNENQKIDKMKKVLEGYTYALAIIDEQNKKLEQQQKQIEYDKPKVEGYTEIVDSNGLFLIRQVAKMIGTGEKRLYSFLREHKIIFYNMKTEFNEPYQEYIDSKYFEPKIGKNKNDPKTRTHSTIYVTPKGIDFIRTLWKEYNNK